MFHNYYRLYLYRQEFFHGQGAAYESQDSAAHDQQITMGSDDLNPLSPSQPDGGGQANDHDGADDAA